MDNDQVVEPFPTTRDIGAGYDAAASEYTKEFADELEGKPFDRELLSRFAARTPGHLPRELVPVALVELRRVLRPDGHLLLAVHAGEGAVHRDRWYDHPVNMAATLFTTDELLGYLSAAGFVAETSETRPPYDFEYQSERIYVSSRPATGHRDP
jgi:SAM-dependent methyltransferase